jgi:hypothetical protein
MVGRMKPHSQTSWQEATRIGGMRDSSDVGSGVSAMTEVVAGILEL